MIRIAISIWFALAAISLQAQERPQRGTIKEITAKAVVITVNGKEVTCSITAETRWMSADNKAINPPIQDNGVKTGVSVMFRIQERNGKHVLIGLKLVGNDARVGTGRGPATEPGTIRRGKITKLDLDKRALTLSVNDKIETFELTEDAIVLGASGKTLRERFTGIKKGADVHFKVAKRDGKAVVVAVKPTTETTPTPLPKEKIEKLVPLTRLAKEKYQGFEGGLYPQGKNQRPADHEASGLALARQVRPLDREGKPDAKGSIVLLSVGMSNTSQISQGFQKAFAGDKDKNPRVVFVNGAQGGMTAEAIQDPQDKGRGARYWQVVEERLKAAGVTPNQVQVIWIKQADASPSQGFPAYARKLQAELSRIVQLLPGRFPNIKLVYLSSRTYAGFAKSRLNPEPYAYESAFSVKWLIEQQLRGDATLNYDAKKRPVKAPWLSWGPYLWENGVVARADGYRPVVGDFAGDGTHHAGPGVEKLGALLLQFFKTDTTTRPWFVRRESDR